MTKRMIDSKTCNSMYRVAKLNHDGTLRTECTDLPDLGGLLASLDKGEIISFWVGKKKED